MNEMKKLPLIMKILLLGIAAIICGVLIYCLLMLVITEGVNSVIKIILIPFLGAVIWGTLSAVLSSMEDIRQLKSHSEQSDEELKLSAYNRIQKSLDIAFKFSFLGYWFGLLIVGDIQTFKTWNDGGNQLFFFSLIFWAYGIFLLIKTIKGFKL